MKNKKAVIFSSTALFAVSVKTAYAYANCWLNSISTTQYVKPKFNNILGGRC